MLHSIGEALILRDAFQLTTTGRGHMRSIPACSSKLGGPYIDESFGTGSMESIVFSVKLNTEIHNDPAITLNETMNIYNTKCTPKPGLYQASL